ncbi:MAG: alpha/beta hydrolase [Candidatus Omnitrophota bacterium]|nr:alpha/beta hydrolase [Candidatus Omnitrophota bacterium]
MRIFLNILLGLGLIFTYVKYLEYKGVYYPAKEILNYPSSAGISFKDIYITTEDNFKINGWFIPNPKAKYTLFFFHGNAGNIGDRIDKLQLLYHADLNIFIIDYRGFGKSQGRPSEPGFYRDAFAAYDYLLNTIDIKPEQIILYGESLGSAIAVDLAFHRKVKALILEGAFSCGRDMAVKIYPFLPRFIFSNSFDSLTKIKEINASKLFIHSRDDEIVPFNLAKELYDRAKWPKEFLEIRGDHNSAFLSSQYSYISSISTFIEKL